MRRIAWSGVALLLMLVSANPALGQGWRAGISGGAVYSNVSGDFVQSSEGKWGFEAGVFGAYNFSPNFGLMLEAMYVQQGANNIVSSAADTFDLKMGYFQFPALLVGTFNLGTNFEGALYGGAAINIESSCKTTTPLGELDCSQVGSNVAASEFSTFSIPLGGAIGYRMPDKSLALILDARYDIGLTDMMKGIDMKSRTWQFMLRLFWYKISATGSGRHPGNVK